MTVGSARDVQMLDVGRGHSYALSTDDPVIYVSWSDNWVVGAGWVYEVKTCIGSCSRYRQSSMNMFWIIGHSLVSIKLLQHQVSSTLSCFIVERSIHWRCAFLLRPLGVVTCDVEKLVVLINNEFDQVVYLRMCIWSPNKLCLGKDLSHVLSTWFEREIETPR